MARSREQEQEQDQEEHQRLHQRQTPVASPMYFFGEVAALSTSILAAPCPCAYIHSHPALSPPKTMSPPVIALWTLCQPEDAMNMTGSVFLCLVVS